MSIELIESTTLLEDFKRELKEKLPNTDLTVVLHNTNGYYGAEIRVVLYNFNLPNGDNIRTQIYEIFQKYEGKILGKAVKHYYAQNSAGESETVKSAPFDLILYQLSYGYRSKQLGKKITWNNFRETIVEFSDPQDGEIVFGLENGGKFRYGCPKGTTLIGVRRGDKLSVYFAQTAGLLTRCSKSFGDGKTTQDVLSNFFSVEFDV